MTTVYALYKNDEDVVIFGSARRAIKHAWPDVPDFILREWAEILTRKNEELDLQVDADDIKIKPKGLL